MQQNIHKQRVLKFFNYDVNFKSLASFYTKQFYLSILAFALLIAFIVTITLGYVSPYNKMWIPSIPLPIRTCRAVSIFFCTWYIFCFVWLLKIGIEQFNHSNNTLDKFGVVAYLPIFNIICIVNIFKQNKNNEVFKVTKNFFKPSQSLKQKYNYKSPQYITAVIVLVVMFPEAIMVWIPSYTTTFGAAMLDSPNVWFYGLQYFTIQTNLLCILYMLLFVIHPYFRIFKDNTFLNWSMVYILIVCLTYNLGLLPINIATHVTDNWEPYKWTKTMWEHVINPIAFMTYYFVAINNKTNTEQKSLFTTIKFGLVIPTIYLTYATLVPFTSFESVYGVPTNCNPLLSNGESMAKIMPYGAWYMFFVVILFWFLFFGVLAGFYGINLAIIKRHIKAINNK